MSFFCWTKSIDEELIYNARRGNLDKVRELLQRGANVNAKGGFRCWTALIWASYYGHLEVVRAFLKHDGVDVNAKDRWDCTALILASARGHLEVVRALLYHNGVDVNIQNKYGMTALILASYWARLEVVHALLNHSGVDVNIMDRYGKTALDVARKKKNDGLARLLEEHMEREKLPKENERNTHKKYDNASNAQPWENAKKHL